MHLAFRRAYGKEVYSLITWNVKNSLLLLKLNLSLAICSMWFHQGVPVQDMGNNCLVCMWPKCHRGSTTPLSCLFSRLNNPVLFSCCLYRKYSVTFCTFSSLTRFSFGIRKQNWRVQYSVRLQNGLTILFCFVLCLFPDNSWYLPVCLLSLLLLLCV